MNSQNIGPWIVMKFGGTSVSTAQCWSTICEQARVNLAGGKRVMIVVSALSGTTNLLTRLTEGPAREESDEIVSEMRENHQQLCCALGLTPSTACEQYWSDLHDLLPHPGSTLMGAEKALLLAHGELLSSQIGFEVLMAAQLDPVWQDARNLLQAEPGSGSDALAVR
ncbi:MAG: bifunctional aspartate kinase/diaminopimelate decarboxylase, partial [Proteobacteria bacterium]|nr:bifunctional aspartate kinase/diaminopimelate decarboxylase [Pseudomonadota bacterium]